MLDILSWAVEQSCAKTHRATCTLENVVVATGGTATPKFLIPGEIAEVNRTKPEFTIELEYSGACGDAENFRIWIVLARQRKRCVLNATRNAMAAVRWGNDQSRVRNVAPVLPRLNVAKADKRWGSLSGRVIECDDRFALLHFLADVLWSTACDPCTTLQSRLFDELRYRRGIAFMIACCYQNSDGINVKCWFGDGWLQSTTMVYSTKKTLSPGTEEALFDVVFWKIGACYERGGSLFDCTRDNTTVPCRSRHGRRRYYRRRIVQCITSTRLVG